MMRLDAEKVAIAVMTFAIAGVGPVVWRCCFCCE